MSNPKKSILIVDDEPALREIFMDEFQYLGFEVFEAENGKVAFELLQDKKIDVMLSDVRMPICDGKELVTKIYESKELHKPLIFIYSGFSDFSPEEAKKMGTIEVFAKPFNLDNITQKIMESLKDS